MFEIEGIDLRDYRRTRQGSQELWLRGARLRGVLEATVITVTSVILPDEVTTLIDRDGFRKFECNRDAPVVADDSLHGVDDGVRLESGWFINPYLVEYIPSLYGEAILHSPIVTRDIARAVCADQSRPVLMFESNDFKICRPDVACEFVEGK